MEDGNGQVGYVPVAYLMIIIDETLQEEESDTTRKEGDDKNTDGMKIGREKGQDGVRRKSYSAAVNDVIKRNSTIYVGDSIVRKTDSTLNKEDDIVVCLPEAKIEHITERVQVEMEGPYWFTRNNSNSEEMQEYTEEDGGSEGWIYHLIRDFTSVWNQDPMIQTFGEDSSQRDGEAAVYGRGSGFRRFVGELCGEIRKRT